MLLNELLKAIQPVQVTGDSKIEITGVNIDSRLVEAGQLFMAMRGTQTDGHAYIPAAIQKGATAILCEDLPEEPVAGITYIQVKDSEDAVRYITVICPIKNSADAPKLSAKFKNKAFNENGLEVEVKVNGKKQSLNYKL